MTSAESDPASPTPPAPETPGSGGSWARILGSAEVDRDPRLKVIGACLLFFCHMTFHDWWRKAVSLSTAGDELFLQAPPPLFEDTRWIFLDLVSTQAWLFALGMISLLGMFLIFLSRSSLPALLILAGLFLSKLYFYCSDFRLFANFHHFHLFFIALFLVSPDKLRFFRGGLAVAYLCSGIVKLSPSWLHGEYFNSLPGKLPFLPEVSWFVTAASVGVVALEFLGPLCWFTRLRWLRRLSMAGFIVFHVYSGFIIGFFYTSLMLPLVLAAFRGFHEPLQKDYHFSPRHLAPFTLLALALLGNLFHYTIPGNVRLTGEGRYSGLFMVDARHAVHFEARIVNGDRTWIVNVYRNWRINDTHTPPDSMITCILEEGGRPVGQFIVSEPIWDGDQLIFNPGYFTAARERISGDPYLYYHYARELVRRCDPDQVSIRLSARLDGHEQAAVLIDIPDFAALDPDYNPFGRNEWILLPGPEAPASYRWH